MNSTKYYGLGRRKSSVAKVYLTPGHGKLTIIQKHHGEVLMTKTAQEYFPNALLIKDLSQPLTLLKLDGNYDVQAQVHGGGFSGQAGAIRLAISRALLSVDQAYKPVLKASKLTTSDSRVKERKKFGKYGARRSPQFTKR